MSVKINDSLGDSFINQIKDQLREQIRSGKLPVGTRLPSLRILSDSIGVSNGIVRQSLGELADEGYVRIFQGRGVFASDPLESKKNIALVLPCLTMGHVFRMVQGVKGAISERSSNLILQAADLDFEQEMDMIHKLDRSNIAGAIIYPPLMNKAIHVLQELQRRQVPAVLIDTVPQGLDDMDSFTTDNLVMGEMAMEYLLSRGHRRIGIIDTNADAQNAEDIREGVRSACRKFRLDYDSLPKTTGCSGKDNWLIEDSWEAIGKDTIKFVMENPDITAILGMDENIAAGALLGLQSMGRKVPEDVSIIGLGYLDAFKLSTPRITTIDRQYEKIGYMAGKRLLEIMGQTTRSRSESVKLAPVLREQQSVISLKDSK